ncbi:MAG TPA: hypothetical protein VI934_02135 [Candidatus Nanoarchaeia archaeon]|nr:hypothetical protein [Candidatus Nanoarchaeia archaeon]
MELFDQKIAIWIISAVAAYLFYKWMFGRAVKGQPLNRYETEIEEILTSDKYKVKGRFED